MIVLMHGIAVLMICLGALCLVSPILLKQMLSFCLWGKRLYIVALFRIVFGIILLGGASQVKVVWIVQSLGTLFLLTGATVFLIGIKRTARVLDWWQGQNDRAYRLLASVSVFLGIILLLSL